MLMRSNREVSGRSWPRRRGWLTAACVGVVVACGGQAMAQASNEARTLFAFQHEGLDAMFPDQRDAGLLAALRMLPGRLHEIHRTAEIQRKVPWLTEEMLALAWDITSQPSRFIVTTRGNDPSTGRPLIGAVVSVKVKDQATAEAYHSQLYRLINEQATREGMEVKPSKRIKTMSEIDTPGGPLSFGPRSASDGWRYEILFGSAPGPDTAFASMPTLPVGATTSSFVIDFKNVGPLIQPLLGFATMSMPEEQGKEFLNQLSAAGVIGENAVRYEWVVGYNETHSVQLVRMIGMKKNAEALGLSLEPLTPEDLAVIPIDATAVQVWKADAMQAWKSLRRNLGTVASDLDGHINEFHHETGVHLVNDVIASLGSTAGVYLSESGGGGSFMSATFFASLKDGAKLAQANTKLLKKANECLSENGPSPDTIGFRLVPSQHRGGTVVRFRADGMPIPVMPSYAIGQRHLIAGLTPQAVEIGLSQSQGSANNSLLSNPAFAENLSRWQSPIVVKFVDCSKTIADGYWVLQLGATMLETAVSSPYGDRTAPQVLPPLAELRHNIKPILQLTSWDGDDMVVHITSDRSGLATVASLLGVGHSGSMLMGSGLGMAIGSAVTKFHGGYSSNYDWDSDWDDDWDGDWDDWDDEDDDVDF
jgi:hypothetical protein